MEDISAYLDGALSKEEEHRVHDHLRACSHCSRYLVDLVPMLQMLRSLPEPVSARDGWTKLERALVLEPRFARRSAWAVLSSQPRWVWAAACALVVGLAAIPFLGQGQPESVADVDLYWHQHELYSHEEGEPTLYAPELSVIKASYQLEP